MGWLRWAQGPLSYPLSPSPAALRAPRSPHTTAREAHGHHLHAGETPRHLHPARQRLRHCLAGGGSGQRWVLAAPAHVPAVAGPSPQPLTPALCCAASDSFRNPPSRDAVPPYEQLPTAHAYMTLEAAVATYACSAPSPAVLRVGGDTACGGQSGRHPCNGPLPSPGPYR